MTRHSHHLPTVAPSVRKVSVAIGHEELEWARERAAREGTSLSAVLTDAARLAREVDLRRERQRLAWAEFLGWATDGAGLSDEDLERGRRELEEV